MAIFARATQNLHRFNLDLRDFLRRLAPEGESQARFVHPCRPGAHDHPAAKLRRGQAVRRRRWSTRGKPQPIVDPDGSSEGWIPTDDGAFVVNEPQGSPGWYPGQRHAARQGDVRLRRHRPRRSTAMANGVLISRRNRRHDAPGAGSRRARWRPISPTVTNGPFETRFGRLPNGLPEYNAVDPDTRVRAQDPPNPALAWERLDAAARDRRVLLGPLRELPVREHRRDHRLGARRGLRAGVPDASRTTTASRVPRPWSTRSPTSGSATRSRSRSGPTSGSTRGSPPWSEWIYDERHGGATAQEMFDELYATAGGHRGRPGPVVPGTRRAPGPAAYFPHARL